MLDVSKWYMPPKSRSPGPSEGSLKPRLENARRVIKIHVNKLDTISKKLHNRDQTLFGRIVSATQRRNKRKAAILANELAEVRKISKTLMQSKIALEQVEMRIGTVSELGEFTTVLATANNVVNNVKSGISTVIPAAEGSFNDMSGMLNSLLIDTSKTGEVNLNVAIANDDAENILAEAASVAELRLRESLPEIPSALTQQGIPEQLAA